MEQTNKYYNDNQPINTNPKKTDYKVFQLNLFIDMVKTYKSNFPYLIFNSKTFIENIIKGLDFKLIKEKNLYDIDHSIQYLLEINKINKALITRVTELSNYIRRVESGNIAINYETTIEVLLETASLMIEVLYLEEKHNNKNNNDHAATIYIDELNKKIKNHQEQLYSLIRESVNENDENNIINVIGPVYFYSSGEYAVKRSKRALFVDIENAIILEELTEDSYTKNDDNKEKVVKTQILTKSAKTITLYIWRGWKSFKMSLKKGSKISILGAAVRDLPDFDEVHLLERSLLIIEPDILINATTIANVIEKKGFCPNKYLLKLKKRNITTNKAALRGVLVGEIIDDYVSDMDNFDFEESFRKHYREKLHKIPFLKEVLNPQEIYRQIATQMYVINTFVWNASNPTYNIPQYIEPFYIAPKYGLEGRMDMIYVNKKEKTFDLYELKSGKAPYTNYDPWDNHLYQTFCYKLIANCIYKYNDNDSNSYVLYSSSDDPIREIKYNLTLELIKARNKIIELISLLTNEKTDRETFLEIHKESMCFNCPSYLRSECINDYELFNSVLSKDELDYYIGFFKQLEKEKYTATLQTSYLWNKTINERESLFIAITGLSIDKKTNDRIVFRISKENNSDLRVGDNVFIHRGKPTEEQLFRGSIISIKKIYIVIKLHKSFPDNFQKDGWCIDRAYSKSGIDAQHSGLYTFITKKGRIKDLILGRIKPEFKKRLSKKSNPHKKLNTKQKEAFELCMRSKDYTLIQGPPGTGKTFTIASIIKQFAKEGKKVLVTAYTNRAVDNILKTLKDKFDYKSFVRIGSIYNIDPDIFPNTIDNIVNDYDIDETKRLKEDLLSKDVFASTTTSAITTLIFDHIDFDVVIVDEAGQMTEPSTLTVITMGKKFLLFGDDKQLPPIVSNEVIAKPFGDNEYLKSIGLTRLGKSLFERLWKLNKEWENKDESFRNTVTLDIQYRMNEQIANISDKFFYNNIIKSDVTNRSSTIKDLGFSVPMEGMRFKSILDALTPVSFISCIDRRVSKENNIEADLVYNLTLYLLLGGLEPEQIGIITPYKAQCALIRKKLDLIPSTIAYTQNIIVDTVERYQGGEKEIIIVSFTVGDENMMQFLSENNEDPLLNRKLNVSITRAKKKLIMLGNSEVLKLDRVYQKLLYFLQSRKLMFYID